MNPTHDLPAYRERLSTYSNEELEDIYYNIDILKNARRYRMLIGEMERRRLLPADVNAERRRASLRDWIDSRPFFASHPTARAVALTTSLFLVTAVTTFVFYSPIWLLAIPLKVLEFQTSLVYCACAPIPPILAAGFGGRLGGRGLFMIPVLLGVVAGMAAFNLTGTPEAIIRALVLSQSGGGFSFGGF